MLLFVARTPFISVCFLHDEYKTDERYWKLNPDRAVPTLQDMASNLTLTSPYNCFGPMLSRNQLLMLKSFLEQPVSQLLIHYTRKSAW